MSEKWNGIPRSPDQDGYHWIGFVNRMEPHYWFAAKFKHLFPNARGQWAGLNPNDPPDAPLPFPLTEVEYLGPCALPPGRAPEGFKVRS